MAQEAVFEAGAGTASAVAARRETRVNCMVVVFLGESCAKFDLGDVCSGVAVAKEIL